MFFHFRVAAAAVAACVPWLPWTTERLSQSDVQLNQVAENAIADLKSKLPRKPNSVEYELFHKWSFIICLDTSKNSESKFRHQPLHTYEEDYPSVLFPLHHFCFFAFFCLSYCGHIVNHNHFIHFMVQFKRIQVLKP